MSKITEAKVVDLLKLASVASIAVAGEGGVGYSESFAIPLSNGGVLPTFSLEYRAASDDAVAVKLEIEQANQEPATEGAVDGNFVVADGAAELDNSLEDENIHIKAFVPAATAFMRIKATGLTGNHASTVLDRLRLTFVS